MADEIEQSESYRKTLMRREILTKATKVFEKKGFSQARLQDISEAMSLTRSALYHYFTSKEAILEALIEEHASRRAEAMDRLIAESGRSPLERLRTALIQTIMERLKGGSRLKVLDQLVAEMPAELRKLFDDGRRHILDIYTRIIAEGVEKGEIEAPDARIAAFAVLGVANWTSWWYSPRGGREPAELAEMLADRALNGLLPRQAAVMALDRAGLLEEIRVRVERLQALEADLPPPAGRPRKVRASKTRTGEIEHADP